MYIYIIVKYKAINCCKREPVIQRGFVKEDVTEKNNNTAYAILSVSSF